MMRLLTAVVGCLTFAGCTHQNVYDNIQQDNARRCIERPESQYEQCMKDANIPYEQYQREREDLLSSPE